VSVITALRLKTRTKRADFLAKIIKVVSPKIEPQKI